MTSDRDPDNEPAPTGAPPRPPRRGRIASVLVFLMIAVVTVAAGGLVMLHRMWTDPGPLAAATTVIVPKGSSGRAIGSQLVEAGAVADARLFQVGLRVFAEDRPLKAGEYALPRAISLRDLVDKLQAGDTVVRRLTVAEGLTTSEALLLLAAAPGLTGEAPAADAVGEGTLLPETYHYSWGDDRAAMVTRMRAARDAVLAELWPARAQGLPLASPEEAVVLASIVEKETAVPEERPRVAAVFVNRLGRGMRLQSDPTVAYGLAGEDGVLDRPLSRADLDADHPYNTYVHAGLPPGPIANPGRASLAAVLDPADTRDLYFVADGTGGHAFAETLAEHNRNVAKWRRIQRERRRDAR